MVLFDCDYVNPTFLMLIFVAGVRTYESFAKCECHGFIISGIQEIVCPETSAT